MKIFDSFFLCLFGEICGWLLFCINSHSTCKTSYIHTFLSYPTIKSNKKECFVHLFSRQVLSLSFTFSSHLLLFSLSEASPAFNIVEIAILSCHQSRQEWKPSFDTYCTPSHVTLSFAPLPENFFFSPLLYSVFYPRRFESFIASKCNTTFWINGECVKWFK